MRDCLHCKHATLDYCEYYGGAKQWYVEDCTRGQDVTEEGECEEFEEWEGSADE